MPGAQKKKVLLIGWDAADWKIIHRLVDEGKMPAMEKLLDAGVCGNLATLQPVLSPMLWTSIATGKRPFKHGIHGFTEPDPQTGMIRPITNLSRKTKALWNILNQENKKSVVVGWWPSHPAEPIDGVMVSNHYQRATGTDQASWSMEPGTVHPERLTELLKELRFHPSELEANHILPFVPKAAEIDQRKDRRLQSLAKIIADCTSIHSAATALIQNEEWDFMAVYYDAIDHFGHGFMKYHPPRRPQVSEKDFELYKDVVEGGYRYHDMMLEVLLHLAGEDATVIVMSDHGFHPDHLRPEALPLEPAGPAAEHRQFGIFVAKGPGLKKDERVYGANLLDVCPTILTIFGLPVGQDMDGKPLLDIFEVEPDLRFIPSWDEVPGETGMHPPDTQIGAEDAKAAVDQLVALGYIAKPDADQGKAVEETVRELRYNLAQSYMDAGRFGDAEGILEELYEKWPREHRFGGMLATCYRAIGRLTELRALTDGLIAARLRESAGAAAQLARLRYHEARLARKASVLWKRSRSGRQRKRGLIRREENRPVLSRRAALRRLAGQRHGENLRQLRARANPNLAALRQFQAFADLAENQFEEALGRLKEAGEGREVILMRGEVLLRMRRWEKARDCFRKVLEEDDENPAVQFGLARAALGEGDYPEAVNCARASIGLLFHQPRAHYLLGMACLRIGDAKRAAEALEVAVCQNPTYAAAYRVLAGIHRRWLKDDERAEHYAAQAKIARRRLREYREGLIPASEDEAGLRRVEPGPLPELDPRSTISDGVPDEEVITIVTGLPRTGTSLMMQMLEAGGLGILTDGKRAADESNPRGYYEDERATRLHRDQAWLPDARGKVVKIVAQLLPTLPEVDSDGAPFHYRVVFMERDLEEVIASQHRMLEREEREGEGAQVDLRRAFTSQLAQVRRFLAERRIPVREIAFREAIADGAGVARTLREFLGSGWDALRAARVVDPALHREKAAAKSG